MKKDGINANQANTIDLILDTFIDFAFSPRLSSKDSTHLSIEQNELLLILPDREIQHRLRVHLHVVQLNWVIGAPLHRFGSEVLVWEVREAFARWGE